MADPPALQAQALWFGYDDDPPVLRGVDLEVPVGQFLILAGANGSGKTTLVKHFIGLLRPRQGRVLVYGQETATRSVGELAHWVGFLFQRPERQIFSPTVRQEVAFGPHNLGLPPAEVEERVEAALARFGLTALADHPPSVLSYGLRRRVTLASVAAMDPPILVLDEPTVGLDRRATEETLGWLHEMHRQGRTLLVVTHNLADLLPLAQRMVVLQAGRVVADGPPRQVLTRREVLQEAGLEPPPITRLAQTLRPQGMRGDSLTVDDFCQEFLQRLGSRQSAAPVAH